MERRSRRLARSAVKGVIVINRRQNVPNVILRPSVGIDGSSSTLSPTDRNKRRFPVSSRHNYPLAISLSRKVLNNFVAVVYQINRNSRHFARSSGKICVNRYLSNLPNAICESYFTYEALILTDTRNLHLVWIASRQTSNSQENQKQFVVCGRDVGVLCVYMFYVSDVGKRGYAAGRRCHGGKKQRDREKEKERETENRETSEKRKENREKERERESDSHLTARATAQSTH
ncbi:hypothetical protein PUN28_001367 [Cardiocondyla obscurior]|uniref:Uncharacterized protein n=1 Tax=Cardiocondyla obscurior TaxID=286306 RepID=A0AAW2H559_9HYME